MPKAGERLGRFDLVRELGRGSHGVVFEATDSLLGESVAIKALQPWLATDMTLRERFKREIVLTRRVSHPGVCRLYDLHDDGDSFYISMQFVDGRSLSQVLRQDRPNLRRVIKILRGMAVALYAAHSAGVIHRDLKPGNVMATADDSVVVLDFGIATASGVGQLTKPGQALGSVPYIPPEVWDGQPHTALGDQYAVGVIGYVCAAHELPYNGKSPLEVLDAIRGARPSMRAKKPDIDARYEAIILRAMSIAPTDRFPDMKALDDALRGLEDELDGIVRAPESITPRSSSAPSTAFATTPPVDAPPASNDAQTHASADAPVEQSAPSAPSRDASDDVPLAPAGDLAGFELSVALLGELAPVSDEAAGLEPAGDDAFAAPRPTSTFRAGDNPFAPLVTALAGDVVTVHSSDADPPTGGADLFELVPSRMVESLDAAPAAARDDDVNAARIELRPADHAEPIATVQAPTTPLPPKPAAAATAPATVASTVASTRDVAAALPMAPTTTAAAQAGPTHVRTPPDAARGAADDDDDDDDGDGDGEHDPRRDPASPPTRDVVVRVVARNGDDDVDAPASVPPRRRGLGALLGAGVVAAGIVAAVVVSSRNTRPNDDAASAARLDAGAATADAPVTTTAATTGMATSSTTSSTTSTTTTPDTTTDAGMVFDAADLAGRPGAAPDAAAAVVVDAGAPPRLAAGPADASSAPHDRAQAPASHAPPAGPPAATGAGSTSTGSTAKAKPASAQVLKDAAAYAKARGLLAGDVTALDQALERGIAALKAGRAGDVETAARDARVVVDRTRIDKAFVGAKLERFNKAYDAAGDPSLQASLKPLAKDVVARVARGDWAGANAKLNEGFPLLKKRR